MRRLLVGLLAAVLALLAAGGAEPVAGQAEPDAVSSAEGPVQLEGGAHPDAGQAFDPGVVEVTEPEAAPRAGTQALPAESIVGSAESVLNVDDRTRVTNTTAYPNSAIGRLQFRGGAATYHCTGFLIDANSVLTSGHCVHRGGTADGGDFFTRHVFTPGQNAAVAPFGSCGATDLWTTPEWFEAASEFDDLGVVQLDCAVGDTVGWFGYLAVPGDGALRGLADHVRGYPGDKRSGTMWTDRKRVRVSQADMVFYRNDTYGGQSVSPVFTWDARCDGPCAMAVHGYGTGHGPPPHTGHNHGPRITEQRAEMIAAVAGANGG